MARAANEVVQGGFLRDSSTGSLIVTTDPTGAVMRGGYLRDPDGRLVVQDESGSTPTASEPLPTRPLSADSQWYRPLGTVSGEDVFYDGQATDIGKWIADRINFERTVQGNGPWVATSNSTSYVWVADENTPLRKINVRTDIAASWRKPLQTVLNEVPIDDAWYTTYTPPDSGEDSVLTVYAPHTDTLYELFWFRRKDGPGASGTLPGGDPDWLESPFYTGADPNAYGSCHWGGVMKNASKSFGVFDMASYPPYSRPNWGASAGSHVFTAGLITHAELLSGEINHAIAVDFGKMRSGVFTHPAFRTDGLNLDPYSIPYGAHFRLPPELDLDAISFATPFAKMVAKAMQKYGMIARNQTGSAFTIFCADPRPDGNAEAFWLPDGTPNPDGWFEGFNPPAALDGIPWDSFLLLEQYSAKTKQTFQVEGGPTVYQQTKILEQLAGVTPAATRYLGLLKVPDAVSATGPNRNGAGNSEFSGNGYGRVAIDPADWTAVNDTGITVTISNAVAKSFAAATADWPAPGLVGIFDAEVDGNLLAYGWLPPVHRNAVAAAQVVTLNPGDVWFQDVGASFYANSDT